jgi:hypothetical protein
MKKLIKVLVVIVVLFFFAGCKKDAVCNAVQGDWELVN